MILVLQIFAATWTALAGSLLLYGQITVLWHEGILAGSSHLRELLSPFNWVEYGRTMFLLSPALSAFAIASAMRTKRTANQRIETGYLVTRLGGLALLTALVGTAVMMVLLDHKADSGGNDATEHAQRTDDPELAPFFAGEQ